MRAERRVGLRPPMLVKNSGSVSEPGSGMPDSECMVDAGGGGDGRWGSQEGYESESLEDVGELRRSPENIEQEKEQNQYKTKPVCLDPNISFLTSYGNCPHHDFLATENFL